MKDVALPIRRAALEVDAPGTATALARALVLAGDAAFARGLRGRIVAEVAARVLLALRDHLAARKLHTGRAVGVLLAPVAEASRDTRPTGRLGDAVVEVVVPRLAGEVRFAARETGHRVGRRRGALGRVVGPPSRRARGAGRRPGAARARSVAATADGAGDHERNAKRAQDGALQNLDDHAPDPLRRGGTEVRNRLVRRGNVAQAVLDDIARYSQIPDQEA